MTGRPLFACAIDHRQDQAKRRQGGADPAEGGVSYGILVTVRGVLPDEVHASASRRIAVKGSRSAQVREEQT
jgi:hypothetical protein